MWRVYLQENLNRSEWAGPWIRRAQGQPSWVFKAAAAAVLLVVVLPLALLTLAALAVGAVVFFVLLAVVAVSARLMAWWYALTGQHRDVDLRPEGGDTMRENVRIIHRDL